MSDLKKEVGDLTADAFCEKLEVENLYALVKSEEARAQMYEALKDDLQKFINTCKYWKRKYWTGDLK